MISDRSLSRAARALLKWSAERLGDEAFVSLSTVRAFESGEWVHINHGRAMHAALIRGGVEFLPQEDGRNSVRLHISAVIAYEIIAREQNPPQGDNSGTND